MFKKKSQPSTSSTQQRSRCIPLSDILKATNNFDESLVIGRGDFGVVYAGEVFDGKTHVLAAIKRLNALALQATPPSWPLGDVEKLTTFRHPNLASLIGYCVHEFKQNKSMWKKKKSLPAYKEVILVYEHVPNGTLKDHLHENRTPLSWIQRLNICTDVARALHYLHTQPGTEPDATLMHGDIKSSNILLTERLTAKVSEFGLSKLAQREEPLVRVRVPEGSFGYLDAFSLSSGRLTRRSDVHAFGALLIEMLCRMPVINVLNPELSIFEWFSESLEQQTVEKMIDPALKDEVSSDCLKKFYMIAARCLNPLPKQRPRIAELVNILESSVLRDPSNRKGNVNQDVPVVPRYLKEFTIDELEKATQGFTLKILGHDKDSENLFLGWIDEYTLAPSDEALGTAVAVKRITSEIPQSDNEWLEEMNLLGQLGHPNIIRLLGWCNKDEHERLLVYEHVKKSLSDVIHHAKPLPWNEPLTWKKRLEILKGVASGLEYLYTKKGVACHFQCCDILLDARFNAKIGGFGWTEVHERHDGKRLNGSFGYKKTYDYDTSSGQLLIKNDIICFGWVLLEVITGRHLADLAPVYVALKSLDMQAPMSKSNRRKLKKMMDPRLGEGYSREGAVKCMVLASRCAAPEELSRAEIVWSLEQISHLHK